MKRRSKLIKLLLITCLTILIVQVRVLAIDSFETHQSEQPIIITDSAVLNIDQSKKLGHPDQLYLIAQNSGKSSQSKTPDIPPWMIIIGAVIFVIFILSKIQV